MAPKTKLTEDGVAIYLNIKVATWRQYGYNNEIPEPDGHLPRGGGPYWFQQTIDTWKQIRKEARQGRRYPDSVYVNRKAYDLAAMMIQGGMMSVFPEEGYVKGGNLTVPCGYLTHGFVAQAEDDSRPYTYKVLAHRVIWEWQTGIYVPISDDSMVVRHKNEVLHDNRIANLELGNRNDAMWDGRKAAWS